MDYHDVLIVSEKETASESLKHEGVRGHDLYLHDS